MNSKITHRTLIHWIRSIPILLLTGILLLPNPVKSAPDGQALQIPNKQNSPAHQSGPNTDLTKKKVPEEPIDLPPPSLEHLNQTSTCETCDFMVHYTDQGWPNVSESIDAATAVEIRDTLQQIKNLISGPGPAAPPMPGAPPPLGYKMPRSWKLITGDKAILASKIQVYVYDIPNTPDSRRIAGQVLCEPNPRYKYESDPRQYAQIHIDSPALRKYPDRLFYTLAHEYFHAVQCAYHTKRNYSRWATEGSAVWVAHYACTQIQNPETQACQTAYYKNLNAINWAQRYTRLRLDGSIAAWLSADQDTQFRNYDYSRAIWWWFMGYNRLWANRMPHAIDLAFWQTLDQDYNGATEKAGEAFDKVIAENTIHDSFKEAFVYDYVPALATLKWAFPPEYQISAPKYRASLKIDDLYRGAAQFEYATAECSPGQISQDTCLEASGVEYFEIVPSHFLNRIKITFDGNHSKRTGVHFHLQLIRVPYKQDPNTKPDVITMTLNGENFGVSAPWTLDPAKHSKGIIAVVREQERGTNVSRYVLAGYEISVERTIQPIFVVDTSGSMADCMPVVKKNLFDHTHTYPSETELTLISFRDIDHILSYTTADRKSFMQTVSSLQAGGGAARPEAVFRAITTAVDLHPTHLILITNGWPTQEESEREKLTQDLLAQDIHPLFLTDVCAK